jgi:hypothetical protein
LPELLDRAFALAIRLFPLFFILALFSAQADLVLAAIRHFSRNPRLLHLQVPIYLPLTILGHLAYAIAVAYAFQSLLFPARPVCLRAIFEAAVPRLLIFFLTREVLGTIVQVLIFQAPGTLMALRSTPSTHWLHATLAAACVLIGIRLAISWALVPLVVMVERKGFLRAALRSAELVNYRPDSEPWSRRIWVWTLLLALPAVLAGASTVAGMECWAWFTGRPTITLAEWFDINRTSAFVARGVLFFALSFCVWPVLTVLYVECRNRRDGLDFQVRLIENRKADNDSLPNDDLATEF